jgi:hypothetical protein
MRKDILWEKFFSQFCDKDNYESNSLPFNLDYINNVFNFWWLHTNFDITPEIEEKICNSYGVESLEVESRYRVKIAIGKAFEEEEVKNNIEKNLLIPNKIVNLELGLKKLALQMPKKYKNWSIVVKNKNDVLTFGDNNESSSPIKQQTDRSGGSVFACSWASGVNPSKT